jgi:ADP-heptose:LPS heptosyltransferase
MKILISPFAQNLRNGKDNPKNFPYWPELVAKLLDAGFDVVQIGSLKDTPIKYEYYSLHDHVGTFSFEQNLKLKEVASLIKECDVWISVDSFLQHLNQYYTKKRGIVIFSQSDPKHFGYPLNNNILKDKKYLREKQFWLWEQCEYNKDAFVTAEEVYINVLKELRME